MESLAGTEIADREDDRRRTHLGGWRLRREDILHLAADHELDQIVRRRARRGHSGDVLAVLEDRDAVGDGEDLFQTVGDEDDRRAVVAQATEGREEKLHLTAVEGRGRLIHDEQRGPSHESLGNLDQLLIGEGKLARDRFRIDGDAEISECRGGAGGDLRVVDPTIRGRQTPKVYIFGDGQMRAEAQLLMDGGGSALFGSPWRQVIDDGAIERDLTGVWLQHSGHKIDQRALARAVLADEAVDLRRANLELDVSQHDVAGKRLRQPNRRQHRPTTGVIGVAGAWLFAC